MIGEGKPIIGEERRRKVRRTKKVSSNRVVRLKRSEIKLKEKADKRVVVRFVIYFPEAEDVSLSSDFGRRDRVRMSRKEKGLWEVTVKLSPGAYEYKFFADGRWVDNILGCVEVNGVCVQDIPAAKRVQDSSGCQSCLFIV
ncbi:MAG: glycogen-binding domain-containing protein [Candidatus Hodarchaeota archaeon]